MLAANSCPMKSIVKLHSELRLLLLDRKQENKNIVPVIINQLKAKKKSRTGWIKEVRMWVLSLGSRSADGRPLQIEINLFFNWDSSRISTSLWCNTNQGQFCGPKIACDDGWGPALWLAFDCCSIYSIDRRWPNMGGQQSSGHLTRDGYI